MVPVEDEDQKDTKDLLGVGGVGGVVVLLGVLMTVANAPRAFLQRFASLNADMAADFGRIRDFFTKVDVP